MVMFSFVLSGELPTLAQAECRRLCGADLEAIHQRVLVGKIDDSALISRLAFTRQVYKIILQGSAEEVVKELQERTYQPKGTVRIEKVSIEKDAISSTHTRKLLLDFLDRPKVALQKPDEIYALIVIGNRWIVGKQVWHNDEPFEKRKNQYRPCPHPTSLHPKLARAMINLAGPKAHRVLDPFCGSGGHLIEGSLMGLEVSGSDIEESMIRRAKKNLAFFHTQATLSVQDALTVAGHYDAIVTDLPYGRNCKAGELEPLYNEFLKRTKKLTKTIVVSFPSIVDGQAIAKASGLRVKFLCRWPLHKSLEKVLLVLER